MINNARWQVLLNGKVFTNSCLESENDCIEHIEYAVKLGYGKRSDFTYVRGYEIILPEK
jgi:hypothetical protein